MNNMTTSFDAKLFPMTSLVLTHFTVNGHAYSGNASGFFYSVQTPTKPGTDEPQWVRIDGYWFVTNKHVVFPKEEGIVVLVDQFVFHLRKVFNDGRIEWLPIKLDQSTLKSKLKLHSNPEVDVVAIDVTDEVKAITHSTIGKELDYEIGIPATLSNRDLPDGKPIEIGVGSDIVVASYPKNYYDDVNKYPIVKSGIISSAWKLYFRGLPCFLIDAQLFPGSSGGVVLSKPTNWGLRNGRPIYSEESQFVLLGVYSGEPQFEDKIKLNDKPLYVDGDEAKIRRSFGLGIVWYASLIDEIIAGNNRAK